MQYTTKVCLKQQLVAKLNDVYPFFHMDWGIKIENCGEFNILDTSLKKTYKFFYSFQLHSLNFSSPQREN